MYKKRVLNTARIRRITGSFGWIDHRFITGGLIRAMSSWEILLYLFLVTVADKDGLSFYGDKTILGLLKIDKAALSKAREGLVSRSLIDYNGAVYQVLELPGVSGRRGTAKEPLRTGDILKELVNQKGDFIK